MDNPNKEFEWKQEPKAEGIILDALDECIRKNSFLTHLQNELLTYTSTRLFDWLDHVIIGRGAHVEKELENAGFVEGHATSTYRVFHHPRAQLPRVVIKDKELYVLGLGLSCESIANFISVRGMDGWIEGEPFSGYRRCQVSSENDICVFVTERRGNWTMEPTFTGDDYLEIYFEAEEKWLTRSRSLDDEQEAIRRALRAAEEMVQMVGEDLAAWIVLDCERRYWQAKNTAAQVQKARQDRVGMGWANHDHHTFRSSRKHFSDLVRLFEILGFHCRERFWAGAEAGWGAQVMENPKCKLVLFLDVDLDSHEIAVDFAHQQLDDLENLGTVGIWCGLHGDSILKAGMHHLEAQFMFDELTKDLSHKGISMMEPFSNFSYLKQAFTAGEIWAVEEKRVQKLLDDGKITKEQAKKFLAYGAVGSHLENLQRREGYKGFNQKNVSFIIEKTDPRKFV